MELYQKKDWFLENKYTNVFHLKIRIFELDEL